MKELEQTKRISIASVLFILIILIGLLTYKRPKYIYELTPQQAVENVVSDNFLISLNNIPTTDAAIIDIRSPFEFQKGHLENAINIQAAEILNEENKIIFDKLKNENTTVVLYGANPNEALAPYMILNQLGYTNLKIATINLIYTQNKLVTQNATLELSEADVNAFIAASLKKAMVKEKPKAKTPSPPKKVIPIKKKKKMPTEGGC
ncbi:Rhodanese-like domain-containing protein [Lutibacter agarilyticus]|uniref:Rhodanese-like domain-containing protein n=1 Tax=Lutibacter agarilyticus TaxID=1109740 RepID=A0A238YQ90_9FLAO|nr:rhodanese-like domain-containing protein [Lutibacter agarilyticus]SNR72763.1 Rhodanese-like domain-containing protein [Lutibacter agarilyticus]